MNKCGVCKKEILLEGHKYCSVVCERKVKPNFGERMSKLHVDRQKQAEIDKLFAEFTPASVEQQLPFPTIRPDIPEHSHAPEKLPEPTQKVDLSAVDKAEQILREKYKLL